MSAELQIFIFMLAGAASILIGACIEDDCGTDCWRSVGLFMRITGMILVGVCLLGLVIPLICKIQ